jgi:transposase-like protein
MSEFKWRHFEGEIILWAVRWYCRYGISYRDLEQMIPRFAGSRADLLLR